MPFPRSPTRDRDRTRARIAPSAASALTISKQSGMFDFLNMDYIYDSGAGVVGDPDRCIEICKRYEAVGCELLFCLLNPYKIPHDAVMHSIELIGKYVIPELDR